MDFSGFSLQLSEVLLGGLAVWRVTNLLFDEACPFRVFTVLRSTVASWVLVGEVFECFYCLSLWIAIAPALVLGSSLAEMVFAWLGMSTVAILIYQTLEYLRFGPLEGEGSAESAGVTDAESDISESGSLVPKALLEEPINRPIPVPVKTPPEVVEVAGLSIEVPGEFLG